MDGCWFGEDLNDMSEIECQEHCDQEALCLGKFCKKFVSIKLYDAFQDSIIFINGKAAIGKAHGDQTVQ